MITAQEALNRLIGRNELFHDEMILLMRQIMAGDISPELTAAILIGLRVKGESVSEVSAAASVLRELSKPVNVVRREHLIDMAGTGGDRSSTFNISTASMFVASAAGATVAKHGNRSVSSKSGSADVLELLGVPLDLSNSEIERCIDKINLGFMFAPNHYDSMNNISVLRKKLGVRTIFNILGPLTNPAGAPNQLLGVFHRDLVGIMSRVLQNLGGSHAMVVHGDDGLDEITLTGNTMVAELLNGKIETYKIDPRKYGFKLIDSLKPLQVKEPIDSCQKILGVLSGKTGPQRDIVLLNAGAALYCANVAEDIGEGIEKARLAIDSGKAQNKLNELIQFANVLDYM